MDKQLFYDLVESLKQAKAISKQLKGPGSIFLT
jgi:hypothetical protein